MAIRPSPGPDARGGHVKVRCNVPPRDEIWWSPLHRPLRRLLRHNDDLDRELGIVLAANRLMARQISTSARPAASKFFATVVTRTLYGTTLPGARQLAVLGELPEWWRTKTRIDTEQ